MSWQCAIASRGAEPGMPSSAQPGAGGPGVLSWSEASGPSGGPSRLTMAANPAMWPAAASSGGSASRTAASDSGAAAASAPAASGSALASAGRVSPNGYTLASNGLNQPISHDQLDELLNDCHGPAAPSDRVRISAMGRGRTIRRTRSWMGENANLQWKPTFRKEKEKCRD